MRAPRETELVSACLRLLALRGVFAWRNNSGAFVIGRGRARRLVRAGAKGSPDILGVLPGGRRRRRPPSSTGSARPAPWLW